MRQKPHNAARALTVMLLGAVAVPACTHSALAVVSETKYWTLRGAVIAAHDQELDVRHKSGRVITVTVDDLTRYAKKGASVTADRIMPGTRVSIDVQSLHGVDRASRVEIQ